VNAVYIDTSFLLSLLFAEPGSDDYKPYWDATHLRFSSILLHDETVVALHRHKVRVDVWRFMDSLMKAVRFRILDDRIAGRIRADREFGRLRSLDAIHLATACEIRDAIEEPIEIACLDSRLRDSATTLGFALLPR
jgi:predicted nucleic acid-binding protein